jgi:uncharacterized protein (TIRG00374 family)
MKNNISTIIILAIIIIAFIYLFSNAEDLLVLEKISIINLCFLLLLSFIAVLSNGCQFKYLSRLFHIKLTFTEWFGLTVANAMFNYFTPARGGMIARALYMKKRYNLALSEYASLMAGIYWFSFSISSLSAVVVGLGCYFFLDELYKVIIIFSLGILFLCIVIGFILFRANLSNLPISNERIQNILSLISQGLHRFKNNTRFLVPICFFCLSFLLLSAARLYWAFLSVGINVHWLKVLLVQAFVGPLLVLSITPGNLGVKEGIIGMFARMLGISIEQAILGALVDRIIMIVIIFFFGIIYSRLMLNRLSPTPIDQDKQDSTNLHDKPMDLRSSKKEELF